MSTTPLPAALEDFEHALLRQLRRRRSKQRRLRTITAASLAALILTASAVAATRALDQPSIDQQNHTQNLGAAQALLSRFLKASPEVSADPASMKLLTTLGADAGTYAGLNAYIAPAQNGGACIVMLNEASCGPNLSPSHPVQALGLGETSTTPFLLVGRESPDVTKHIVRCPGTSEDVTNNGGNGTFIFVAANPATDPSQCTQEFTLSDGNLITTPI